MAPPVHMLPPKVASAQPDYTQIYFAYLARHPRLNPPLTPTHHLKIPFFEFTYCNHKFPQEATTKKERKEKYDTLKIALTQQGWMDLPTIIITTGIRDSIHTPTIQKLTKLKLPTNKSTN